MSIIDKVIVDKPLEDVVYFLADRMMRRAKEYSKAVFKDNQINVTIDQWVILKRISEQQGIGQKDLANSTYKDPAAVTRILDILERKTLVERRDRPDDRRAYEIYLTTAGTALVNKALPLVQGIRKKGLDGLSAKELDLLKNGLTKIYHNF